MTELDQRYAHEYFICDYFTFLSDEVVDCERWSEGGSC